MLVTWKYQKRRSFIQLFDPRAWLIFFACFMASTLVFWDVRFLCFFLAIALFSVFTSGVRWKDTRRAFLFIGAFVLFFSVLTLFTGRGGMEFYQEEHLLHQVKLPFQWRGEQAVIEFTWEKTFYALSMLVRVLSLALMTILIPYSLDPGLYGVAFHGLGMPDKFAYAMDLTMRFIPSYGRDFQLTMDAQRARGYELEKISGGLFAQVRKLAPLIVPVTIRSIINAEDIIDAMDLRAFGIQKRTWIDELTYRRRDYALIGVGIVIFTVSLALSVSGVGYFWVPLP